MRWKHLRRPSEGSGSVNSQESPAWRPTASDTGRHSGRDTLETLAAEAVAIHHGPPSESRWKPPAEIGDPPSQRVEKLSADRYTRIPRSWRSIAVEDGQAGDEGSYSISPLVTQEGIALSDSEKSEALTDNLEAQFQSVTDPSVLAVYWDGSRGAEVLLLNREVPNPRSSTFYAVRSQILHTHTHTHNYTIIELYLLDNFSDRGAQSFQKSERHFKILGAKRVMWCKIHMEDPQIFCTIVQNTLDLAPEISSHLFNPLNAELNPICHLLALSEAHRILHVSRIRINDITLVKAQNVASESRKESFRRLYNISKEVDGPILLMWKRIRSHLLSMQFNCFSY